MPKLTGIGNAIVDGILNVTDADLENWGLKKADYNKLTPEVWARLQLRLGQVAHHPGGAVGNILWTAAHLGIDAAFLGRVGNDGPGDLFYTAMQKAKIAMPPPEDEAETFQIMVLVTLDGERTFAEPPTASKMTKTWMEQHRDLLQASDAILLESYLLLDQMDAVQVALDTALAHEIPLIMSLAPPHLMELARDNFAQVLQHPQLALLFSDDEEWAAAQNIFPEATLSALHGAERVQTHTDQGATFHAADGTQTTLPTQPLIPMDTTGAGDSFAGGFLSQYLADTFNVTLALAKGNEMGGKVVMQMGGRIQFATAR